MTRRRAEPAAGRPDTPALRPHPTPPGSSPPPEPLGSTPTVRQSARRPPEEGVHNCRRPQRREDGRARSERVPSHRRLVPRSARAMLRTLRGPTRRQRSGRDPQSRDRTCHVGRRVWPARRPTGSSRPLRRRPATPADPTTSSFPVWRAQVGGRLSGSPPPAGSTDPTPSPAPATHPAPAQARPPPGGPGCADRKPPSCAAAPPHAPPPCAPR